MTPPDTIRLQRGQGKKMVRRKPIVVLIGLGLAMAMGLAIYLRLWTIDYRITSDETELIRYNPVFSVHVGLELKNIPIKNFIWVVCRIKNV